MRFMLTMTIFGVLGFSKKNKMAEQHGASKNKKRDLKEIGAIEHEIRDPKIERKYISLSLRKDGSLLATDLENKEVCIFNRNGKLVQSFKVSSSLGNGIVELSDGNIAVSDLNDRLIKDYTPHGEVVKEFGSDELECPMGLAVNNKGQLFVVDINKLKVFVYSEDGEFQYSFGSRGFDLGEFGYPFCICVGQDGLVYVGEHTRSSVLVFQQDDQFIQEFGKNVHKAPSGIAIFEDGHIIVTSAYSNKLSIFTPSGECVHEVKDVGLSCPCDVVVDKNGFIFVADHGNHRIVMF